MMMKVYECGYAEVIAQFEVEVKDLADLIIKMAVFEKESKYSKVYFDGEAIIIDGD